MEPTSSGKMHLSKKCRVYLTWRNVVNVKKQNGLSSDLFSEKHKKTKNKKKTQRAVFMGKLKR